VGLVAGAVLAMEAITLELQAVRVDRLLYLMALQQSMLTVVMEEIKATMLALVKFAQADQQEVVMGLA
jgi:hypothetical protein